MYKQVPTDIYFYTAPDCRHTSYATLESEYGGRVQIGLDDHCYVIYLKNSSSGYYKSTTHIFWEVHGVLSKLPSPLDIKELDYE